MSAQKIVIIDTGSANLTSVQLALIRLGVDAKISAEESLIKSADKLILPGVGSAVAAMKSLNNKGLPSIVTSCTQPILGICLGMQLLGKESAESMGADSEFIKCLGIVDATTKLLKADNLPLPHMGWDQVEHDGTSPLLKDIPSGSYFYFVHSYAMELNESTIATCEYGEKFTAIINKNNFFGTQFHPEKSGAIGAKLLKNFIEL